MILNFNSSVCHFCKSFGKNLKITLSITCLPLLAHLYNSSHSIWESCAIKVIDEGRTNVEVIRKTRMTFFRLSDSTVKEEI